MATQDPMTVRTPEAGELPVRSGRMVRIIKYLVNNQRALGCMEKGELRFQFKGKVLTVSATDYADITE